MIDARCPCDICKAGRAGQLALPGLTDTRVSRQPATRYHREARLLGSRSWPIWWPFRPGRSL